MTTLDKLLALLQLATVAAQKAAGVAGSPEAAAGAALASDLEAIAKSALDTYESHVGQPLDLTQLHKIDPID